MVSSRIARDITNEILLSVWHRSRGWQWPWLWRHTSKSTCPDQMQKLPSRIYSGSDDWPCRWVYWAPKSAYTYRLCSWYYQTIFRTHGTRLDSDHAVPDCQRSYPRGIPIARVHILGAWKDGAVKPTQDDKGCVSIAGPGEDISKDLYVLSTDYKPVNEAAQLRVDSLGIWSPVKMTHSIFPWARKIRRPFGWKLC